MKTILTVVRHHVVAALLGILLTFAFAPYDIFPLAVIAPAGLLVLWLWVTPSRHQAFWLGLFFGLGFFGAGVYWIFISIHTFGGVSASLAFLVTTVFITALALFPACTGYLLNRFFPVNNTSKLVCAFPAIWVFLEIMRGLILSGFPWLFLGYSQTNSPLKGYAPILSVYLVSLMVLISSALVVNAIRQYQQKDFRSLYFNLLALILIWAMGSLLSLAPWTRAQGKPLSVALVQGNIPQEMKWSPEHIQLSLDRYTALTKPLWGKYKLIIWPEAAIPVPMQDIAASFIAPLAEQAKASGSTLMLGIPVQAEKQYGYYNAILSLGTDNSLYRKRHLVPFGEYVPLSRLFAESLKLMDIPMSEMVPGPDNQPPLTVGNISIMPSICFEVAFPGLMHFNDKSINLLLVTTNDAWFGHSSAAAQHLQMAAMRALELGRPVLFVSNDGITAIIGSDGKIESSIPDKKAAVLTGTVQPRYGITPWMQNGIDPVAFIIMLLLFIALRSGRQTARKAQKTLEQNPVITTQKT